MTITEQKLESIFVCYKTKGFSPTTAQIAEDVGITKKTLFNRYQTKENLEKLVLQYWQKQSMVRLDERCEFANNEVEKLLLFLYELQHCKRIEPVFFEKTKVDSMLFGESGNSHFLDKVCFILQLGKKSELFQFETDAIVYAGFFLQTVFHVLLVKESINTDYVSLIIYPILTQKGQLVIQDIDIEQFFD